MSTPFSTNPKLADWVSSEQQIQTISGIRELLELVTREEGSEIHKSVINALNVMCHLNPEVTDPQQLVDDTYEFLMQNIAYLSRTQSTGGN